MFLVPDIPFLLTSYFSYSVNWGIPKLGIFNLIQPRCKVGVEICDGGGGAWHGKRMTEMSQRAGESMCKALLFFRILPMRIPERG